MNYEAEELVKVLSDLWPSRKFTSAEVEARCGDLLRRHGLDKVRQAIERFLREDRGAVRPDWRQVETMLNTVERKDAEFAKQMDNARQAASERAAAMEWLRGKDEQEIDRAFASVVADRGIGRVVAGMGLTWKAFAVWTAMEMGWTGGRKPVPAADGIPF